MKIEYNLVLPISFSPEAKKTRTCELGETKRFLLNKWKTAFTQTTCILPLSFQAYRGILSSAFIERDLSTSVEMTENAGSLTFTHSRPTLLPSFWYNMVLDWQKLNSEMIAAMSTLGCWPVRRNNQIAMRLNKQLVRHLVCRREWTIILGFDKLVDEERSLKCWDAGVDNRNGL